MHLAPVALDIVRLGGAFTLLAVGAVNIRTAFEINPFDMQRQRRLQQQRAAQPKFPRLG